jgi:Dioxygenases related to 2-nitropropane dioxygenase
VINQKFAHKAIEKGADGLILVSAGAGGHAGEISPSLSWPRPGIGSMDRSRCRARSATAAPSAPRGY